jgi:ABC-type Fe3+/spermidine/putrescine transport system ATPase subunit
VTHDQEEALTMSDRVLVMNHGRVEQDGAPEALYHHPASRFVAEFIGDTNLLDITVKGVEGEEAVLDWAGVTLRAWRREGTPAPGAAGHAALRPECMRLGAEPLGLANEIEGRIVERLFRGPRVQITVETDGGARLEAALDPARAAALPDGPVRVGFGADRLTVLLD